MLNGRQPLVMSVSDDNVIDIVSIHRQIHHYHSKRPASGDEEEETTVCMNFDFYLVQALPLLTHYQKLLKEKGKIRFTHSKKGSFSAPTEAVKIPAITPAVSPDATTVPGRADDVSVPYDSPSSSEEERIRPFPYMVMENANDSPYALQTIDDLVRIYLEIVQKYFPTLYNHMDIPNPIVSVATASHPTLSPPVRAQTDDPIPSVHAPHLGTDRPLDPPAQRRPVTTSACRHRHLIVAPDGMFVCEKCGLTPDQDHTYSTNISYKDINRVNLASKYLYDRITHFKDCINQFQGKQNSSIDPKVYDDLIRQFLAHDLIPADYKTMPKSVAFKDITKEHIMLFLKESGYTKHYEDMVLIHSVLTGISPPNITALENQLLHDFDQLTSLYDKKYRQHDRKNFINTQYVLYQLLKRHKFPCKKEDFNILKTIDRKFYHDDICKALFEELDWNFNPTF